MKTKIWISLITNIILFQTHSIAQKDTLLLDFTIPHRSSSTTNPVLKLYFVMDSFEVLKTIPSFNLVFKNFVEETYLIRDTAFYPHYPMNVYYDFNPIGERSIKITHRVPNTVAFYPLPKNRLLLNRNDYDSIFICLSSSCTAIVVKSSFLNYNLQAKELEELFKKKRHQQLYQIKDYNVDSMLLRCEDYLLNPKIEKKKIELFNSDDVNRDANVFFRRYEDASNGSLKHGKFDIAYGCGLLYSKTTLHPQLNLGARFTTSSYKEFILQGQYSTLFLHGDPSNLSPSFWVTASYIEFGHKDDYVTRSGFYIGYLLNSKSDYFEQNTFKIGFTNSLCSGINWNVELATEPNFKIAYPNIGLTFW